MPRNEIPVVYAGELKDEQEMLEWLIKNQSSADDDDTIEETDEEKLEIMVDNVDNLLIIFIDNSRLSTRVLDVMETIDDDCDRRDVVFVKVKVESCKIPIELMRLENNWRKFFLIPRIKFLPPSTVSTSSPASSSLKTRSRVRFKSEEFL